MIFDPKIVNYKITMNNDPIEAVAFASFYLYGDIEHLNPPKPKRSTTSHSAKTWVAAYADFRGRLLSRDKKCHPRRRLHLLYLAHKKIIRLRRFRHP